MDKKELFRAIDACKDNFIKEAAEDIQKRKPSVIRRFFFVNSSENTEEIRVTLEIYMSDLR